MKKKLCELGLVYIGVLAGTFAVNMFNRYVLLLLPLYGRLLSMIPVYWLMALVPVIVILRKKIRLETLGFSKENVPGQIFVGIAAALLMSAVLTLLPYLLGLGDMVDDGTRYNRLWKYFWELLYSVAAIGAAEELVFRGYFFARLKELCQKEWVAVLVSSVLFGFVHVFQGNILQVFMMMLLGALFCILRLKVKNCTLLSLIICHGVYDAMISVWASLLLV